jgi:hypothetical protein
MAERPIFIPAANDEYLVEEIFLPMQWHSGFASVQKEKNVRELHAAAKAAGFTPLLEVSTKSERAAGRHLSAFHLKVNTDEHGFLPLECVFQGSKVFENGGPYTDLYLKDAREAKRDIRLKDSGKLIAFRFQGHSFPLEPKTLFYDWLYIGAIFEHREWLSRLEAYAAFTDIEFNPQKSVNCQARSIALFMTLMKRELLEEAVRSPESFLSLLLRHHYCPKLGEDCCAQHSLFQRHPAPQEPSVPSEAQPEPYAPSDHLNRQRSHYTRNT